MTTQKTSVSDIAPLPILGWREWVGLPEFGIKNIKAKIDTGAKTSVVHAFRISEISQNGMPFIRFYLHPEQHQTKLEIPCTAPFTEQRSIRSSNGAKETRYVIKTDICLGTKSFPIELSLTNREELGFRMLLGRDAIKDRYIVNPAHSFLLQA